MRLCQEAVLWYHDSSCRPTDLGGVCLLMSVCLHVYVCLSIGSRVFACLCVFNIFVLRLYQYCYCTHQVARTRTPHTQCHAPLKSMQSRSWICLGHIWDFWIFHFGFQDFWIFTFVLMTMSNSFHSTLRVVLDPLWVFESTTQPQIMIFEHFQSQNFPRCKAGSLLPSSTVLFCTTN